MTFEEWLNAPIVVVQTSASSQPTAVNFCFTARPRIFYDPNGGFKRNGCYELMGNSTLTGQPIKDFTMEDAYAKMV